eukprot:2294226-Pyramimonas_sp.AAC.1
MAVATSLDASQPRFRTHLPEERRLLVSGRRIRRGGEGVYTYMVDQLDEGTWYIPTGWTNQGKGLWSVECALAVIGTGGPVKRSRTIRGARGRAPGWAAHLGPSWSSRPPLDPL